MSATLTHPEIEAERRRREREERLRRARPLLVERVREAARLAEIGYSSAPHVTAAAKMKCASVALTLTRNPEGADLAGEEGPALGARFSVLAYLYEAHLALDKARGVCRDYRGADLDREPLTATEEQIVAEAQALREAVERWEQEVSRA